MRNKFCHMLCAFAVLLTFAASFSLGGITACADETDTASEADTVDGTAYFYNQFTNSAHRNIYKQILEAAQTFHDSDSNATYNDSGYYTAFELFRYI